MRTDFVHEALFYRGGQEYVAGVLPFVRDGLDSAEPVLVAVPAENGDRLQDALGRERAQVRFLDMRTAGRNPGRIIPTVLLAFLDEHPGRRVRVVGEPIWPGRTPTEYPACVQHEALINLALADAPAAVLCPYDVSRLHPVVLADAERTHPVLVRGRGRNSSANYTAPHQVVAAFNRPFPEPGSPVAAMIFHTDGLPRVRNLIARQSQRAGLGPERIEAFQRAVNEVAVNVIEHTDGPGTVRVWCERDRLVCEVRDNGQLTDPLAGRRTPDPDCKRGRGLVLVNYLCDLVQTHTHAQGTTFRLHMETRAGYRR